MKIFRHHTGLPPEARGGCVAVGNFDGVHLGHQQVIRTARETAREKGLRFSVLTFEPHPRRHFQPDAPPFRLTPFRLKARYMEALGVEFLVAVHFDAALAGLTADAFITDVLAGGLEARHLVVGYDFVFGRDRGGSADLLMAGADSHGFTVTAVSAVAGPNGEVYSSTRAREYLRRGEVGPAAALLGRWWEVEGRVEQGDARGRTIGFPTANLFLDEQLRPAMGVYAVRAGVDRGEETVWYDGVANFGKRPTIGTAHSSLEVHLFGFDADIYGEHLRVQLIDFLRGEVKFDGLDALKAQISKDCARARAVLARRHEEGLDPSAIQSEIFL
ncbi:MAG: bifunctional riboflavin kinase/FAD synthetase [Alphaproteobacteria bacterium]